MPYLCGFSAQTASAQSTAGLPYVSVADHDRVVAVVSILDDKDAAGMLAALIRTPGVRIDALVFTNTQNSRALPAGTLQSLTRQLAGPPSEIVLGPRAALVRARELAGPGGVVIAAGSLYLIADLLAAGPRERASSL